jgi:hypothetical protein
MDFRPGATGPVMDVTTPILKVWAAAGGAVEEGAVEEGGGAAVEEVAGGLEEDGGGAGAVEVGAAEEVAEGVLEAHPLISGKTASTRKRKTIPVSNKVLFK